VALNQLGGVGVGAGVAFLVSAGIVAEIIAKACSSPQTLEINAHSRAPTLMKWVNVGAAEATVFVAIAAVLDPAHRVPILAGGALELVITYAEYLHGKQAGLSSSAPGTETTPAPAGRPWAWA
jgi:preprotein translocase subunit SecY